MSSVLRIIWSRSPGRRGTGPGGHSGAIYVWSNERGLYVAETVRVVNGRAVLPLRVLADASGSSLTWDGSTAA